MSDTFSFEVTYDAEGRWATAMRILPGGTRVVYVFDDQEANTFDGLPGGKYEPTVEAGRDEAGKVSTEAGAGIGR
jgi:hypothetical protein